MKAFFGIYMYISVVQIPNYSLAWTSMWPFGNPSIPEIMTRSRFEHINKYFHCNDVSQNPPRRAPGHDMSYMSCYGLHLGEMLGKLQSIQRAKYRWMIAYKGRLSFKQYLPAKPTKFGIKVWESVTTKWLLPWIPNIYQKGRGWNTRGRPRSKSGERPNPKDHFERTSYLHG